MAKKKRDALRIEDGDSFRIDKVDADDSSYAPGDKEATAAKSAALQKRIGELQEVLYAEHKHKVLIVLQGMDTSGKDGTVRHVMSEASPQGIRTVSFKRPTEPELAHDYLWRIHKEVPAAGEITIFNRSHYEDVLVVRVHELVPEKMWKKRYRQINDFEQMLCDNGILLLKFFLHISADEQRERLQARLDDPTKRWKFEHGDIEERKLWDEYMNAYEDVVRKTSTKYAPWHVVPANKKWVRNYIVAKTIVGALESLDMHFPEPDLSKESLDA